jgi:pseudaminic acid synthase
MYIAEVSANHLGSFDRAKAIVKAASNSGATAVKFQTYTADTMTLNVQEFSVSADHELWGGRRLYDLYKEAHTPWEWHGELFELARSLGLIPFSSPFDLSAVQFLEGLNAPMYKIASLETSDHLLIEAAASTGKPIIISTGATELEEIAEAVEVVKKTGNKDLTLLVCTSSYPADPRQSHLLRIETLRKLFNCKIGISDHTLGIGVSVAAVVLGATAIEKHLTLKRKDGGADSAFSMEPDEFRNLVTESNIAIDALGISEWTIQPSESESRKLRRSLYIVKDVVQGEIITHSNVRAIRPGGGGKPKILSTVIGKRFKKSHKAGTPMDVSLAED